MMVCVISFNDRTVIPSQRPGNFLYASVFVRITFLTNNNSTARSILVTKIAKFTPNPSPPRDHMLPQLQRGLRRKRGSSQVLGWYLLYRERLEIWIIIQGRGEERRLGKSFRGVSRMWWGRGGYGNSWILHWSNNGVCITSQIFQYYTFNIPCFLLNKIRYKWFLALYDQIDIREL